MTILVGDCRRGAMAVSHSDWRWESGGIAVDEKLWR